MAYSRLLVFFLLAVQNVYCEEYLIALAKTFKTTYLTAATGQRNGSIEFKLPEAKENKTLQLTPFSRQLITVGQRSQADYGVENKAFILKTSNDDVSVSGCYQYAAFSPLPVSALGTKYMLPFCGVNQKTSFVVIASYDQRTSINITLRLNAERFLYEYKPYDDGNVLNQTLEPFQTFAFKYQRNMTGTVIDATHPIAVFMGSKIRLIDVETYEQIPPVSSFGNEYVVATDDAKLDSRLQVVSAEYDNELHFSDGSMVKSRFYSRVLEKNETLVFTSTKPVMTTICRLEKYRFSSGFVVVPPVGSYRKQEVTLYVPYSKTISTVKVLTKASADVTVQRARTETVKMMWNMIPDSDFKVGTGMISNDNGTSFRSDDKFTVLVFSPSFIQNTGYIKPVGMRKTDTASSTSTPQTTSSTTVHASNTDTTSGTTGSNTGTTKKPSAERITQTDMGKSPVMLVGIVCGIVIVALIAVLAALVTCMKRRRAQSGSTSVRMSQIQGRE